MKSLLLACAAAAAFLAVAGPLDVADARERRIEGAVSGPRGERAIMRNARRGQGDAEATTTITRPNGESAVVNRQRSVDPEAGTASSTLTVTRPDGATMTKESTATRTGEGAWDVTRTRTGFDGQTTTQTGNIATQRDENGRTTSGSMTGPNGTTTFERSRTRDENGVISASGERAGPNGGTRTFDRTIDPAAGTASNTNVITRPDGSTTTVQTDLVRDGDTVTGTRTITPPNGAPITQTGTFTVSGGPSTP